MNIVVHTGATGSVTSSYVSGVQCVTAGKDQHQRLSATSAITSTMLDSGPSSRTGDAGPRQVQHSPQQSYPGCYGLPYADHNYGAPRPPTPPASPPPQLSTTSALSHTSVFHHQLNGHVTVVDGTTRDRSLAHITETINDVLASSKSAFSLTTTTSPSSVFEAPEVGETAEIETDDSITRCICEFGHDDGYMICCDKCSVWQHIDCMGVERNAIPDSYFCERCEPRFIDKKRAVDIQKWKREELLKLALAQGNPADLKKLGVNAKKIVELKQKQKYKKKDKESVFLNGLKKKKQDVKLQKNKFKKNRRAHTKNISAILAKNNNKIKNLLNGPQTRSNSPPSLSWKSDDFFNYVDATTNDYTAEVKDALSRKKMNGLSDTLDSVMCVKLLAQLRNNSYLYVRANKKGLRASESVLCNQAIMEYKGKVMLKEQYERENSFPKKGNPYVLFYAKITDLDLCVDASHYGNEARFIQRSCTPNAEVRHVIHDGRIHLVIYSRSDITKGAEITIPFDFNYHKCRYVVECACSTNDCPVAKFFETIDFSKKENSHPPPIPVKTPPVTPTPVPRKKRASGDELSKKRKAAPLKQSTANFADSLGVTHTITAPCPSDENSNVDVEALTPTLPVVPLSPNDEPEKKKLTREERKMEAIMRAFEKLEKRQERQGRRDSTSRDHTDVDVEQHDDSTTTESESPLRPSVQSPQRPVLSSSPSKVPQSPKSVHSSPLKQPPPPPSPVKTPQRLGDPESPIKIDHLRTPERSSPKCTPNRTPEKKLIKSEPGVKCIESIDVETHDMDLKLEVNEEEPRHFLDVVSTSALVVVKSDWEKTDIKLEGESLPHVVEEVPVKNACSVVRSDSSSEPSQHQPPTTPQPRRKGKKRSKPLTARRRSRANSSMSFSDMAPSDDSCSDAPVPLTPLTPCTPYTPCTPAPVPEGAQLSAFVHKTKKARMNEWLIESTTGPDPVKQLTIDTKTEEQIFVRCMPSPHDLSHLRRSSAGGVRSNTNSTVWSAKKRWLRQAMIEDPSPTTTIPTTPHPSSSWLSLGPNHPLSSIVNLNGVGGSSPTPQTPGSSGMNSPNSCTLSGLGPGTATSPLPVPADIITPLKKRRLARESVQSDSAGTTPSTPGGGSPLHTPASFVHRSVSLDERRLTSTTANLSPLLPASLFSPLKQVRHLLETTALPSSSSETVQNSSIKSDSNESLPPRLSVQPDSSKSAQTSLDQQQQSAVGTSEHLVSSESSALDRVLVECPEVSTMGTSGAAVVPSTRGLSSDTPSSLSEPMPSTYRLSSDTPSSLSGPMPSTHRLSSDTPSSASEPMPSTHRLSSDTPSSVSEPISSTHRLFSDTPSSLSEPMQSTYRLSFDTPSSLSEPMPSNRRLFSDTPSSLSEPMPSTHRLSFDTPSSLSEPMPSTHRIFFETPSSLSGPIDCESIIDSTPAPSLQSSNSVNADSTPLNTSKQFLVDSTDNQTCSLNSDEIVDSSNNALPVANDQVSASSDTLSGELDATSSDAKVDDDAVSSTESLEEGEIIDDGIDEVTNSELPESEGFAAANSQDSVADSTSNLITDVDVPTSTSPSNVTSTGIFDMSETERLISDIDAKIWDLERRISENSAVVGRTSPSHQHSLSFSSPPRGALSSSSAAVATSSMRLSPCTVSGSAGLISSSASSVTPSSAMKRKVSLADYRRRRQKSTGDDGRSSPPHRPSSNTSSTTHSPALTPTLSMSPASLAPLPLPALFDITGSTASSNNKAETSFKGVLTSDNYEGTTKLSEPTLAERVAERAQEMQALADSRPREPQKSLGERLRLEFGVDALSDDEKSASTDDDHMKSKHGRHVRRNSEHSDRDSTPPPPPPPGQPSVNRRSTGKSRLTPPMKSPMQQLPNFISQQTGMVGSSMSSRLRAHSPFSAGHAAFSRPNYAGLTLLPLQQQQATIQTLTPSQSTNFNASAMTNSPQLVPVPTPSVVASAALGAPNYHPHHQQQPALSGSVPNTIYPPVQYTTNNNQTQYQGFNQFPCLDMGTTSTPMLNQRPAQNLHPQFNNITLSSNTTANNTEMVNYSTGTKKSQFLPGKMARPEPIPNQNPDTGHFPRSHGSSFSGKHR